ncbi:hypothetical protein Holit_02603 [Hollandina sp. SP2]
MKVICSVQRGKLLAERFWGYFPVFRTAKLCLAAALKTTGDDAVYVLKETPKSVLNEAICLEVCGNYGYALQFVPQYLKTAELCRGVIAKQPYAVEYTPEKLLPYIFNTQEFCTAAIRNARYNDVEKVLQQVNECFRTDELWRAALGVKGWLLEKVPESMRTRELCEIAVNNSDGGVGVLEAVPDALKTRELCIAALRQSSWALTTLEKAGIDLEKEDMQAIWNVVIAQEGSFL